MRAGRGRSPPNEIRVRSRSHSHTAPEDGEHEDAVVARERRDPGEQPRADERPAAPAQPARGEEQRPRDERLVEREVVGLDHVHERQRRQRGQEARADRDDPRRAGVLPDEPRERRRERTRERERDRGGHRRRAEEPDERHLDERRQRHPVGVGRDREDRVGGDRAADLGEDPDEVDVEAVARRQLPRDVHVVERIGVGGIGEQGRRHESGDEGEQVQGDRNPHGRCSLAPGTGPPRRYESASRTAHAGSGRGPRRRLAFGGGRI